MHTYIHKGIQLNVTPPPQPKNHILYDSRQKCVMCKELLKPEMTEETLWFLLHMTSSVAAVLLCRPSSRNWCRGWTGFRSRTSCRAKALSIRSSVTATTATSPTTSPTHITTTTTPEATISPSDSPPAHTQALTYTQMRGSASHSCLLKVPCFHH